MSGCAPWGAGLWFCQGSGERLMPSLLSPFPSLFVLNEEECGDAIPGLGGDGHPH